MTPRIVGPWDKSVRRYQTNLHREGTITVWPWGPEDWALLWRARACLENKKVSSLWLTYKIQWGRERIIESKVGEIVQGYSLNLMVDLCLDNDKSSTTKVRKDSLCWLRTAVVNTHIKSLYRFHRKTCDYNPLWERWGKSGCDLAGINLSFPSKGWTWSNL